MEPDRDDCWASQRQWWLVLVAGIAGVLWGATGSEICILVPGIVLTAVGCLALGICLGLSNRRARR